MSDRMNNDEKLAALAEQIAALAERVAQLEAEAGEVNNAPWSGAPVVWGRDWEQCHGLGSACVRPPDLPNLREPLIVAATWTDPDHRD